MVSKTISKLQPRMDKAKKGTGRGIRVLLFVPLMFDWVPVGLYEFELVVKCLFLTPLTTHPTKLFIKTNSVQLTAKVIAKHLGLSVLHGTPRHA